MIYLTVIGQTPGGSSTIHIYKQTIHKTTQLTINLICIIHSHNTTIFTVSDGLLHWIQLHVSALDMGCHQVVLKLIE